MCYKRILTSIITLALAMSMTNWALAAEEGNNEVPVTLNTEASTFNVTVPTSLPIWVDKEGKVTTATDSKIMNNSSGPVKISSVHITSSNNWELMSSDKIDEQKVGTKAFNFNLQGINIEAEGEIKLPNNTSIQKGGELNLEYDSKVAPQKQAITEEIANITFVIDWDSIISDLGFLPPYRFSGAYSGDIDGNYDVSYTIRSNDNILITLDGQSEVVLEKCATGEHDIFKNGYGALNEGMAEANRMKQAIKEDLQDHGLEIEFRNDININATSSAISRLNGTPGTVNCQGTHSGCPGHANGDIVNYEPSVDCTMGKQVDFLATWYGIVKAK